MAGRPPRQEEVVTFVLRIPKPLLKQVNDAQGIREQGSGQRANRTQMILEALEEWSRGVLEGTPVLRTASALPPVEHYHSTVPQHVPACVSNTYTTSDTPDKAALVARLHGMRETGQSLAQIAAQLQTEGVPTLSGKGTWQRGTLVNLLKGR